jgi:hypothetical protein
MLYFSRRYSCRKVDRSSRVAAHPVCEKYRRLLELNFQPLTEEQTVQTYLATSPQIAQRGRGLVSAQARKAPDRARDAGTAPL